MIKIAQENRIDQDERPPPAYPAPFCSRSSLTLFEVITTSTEGEMTVCIKLADLAQSLARERRKAKPYLRRA
ncbi:MAG TPA: hypothetical protein VHN14_08995 [Kofleriaceae bacterium]|nr:hypothetical protein [Kofleriaceae bacterium]